jgi:hypothetical protein
MGLEGELRGVGHVSLGGRQIAPVKSPKRSPMFAKSSRKPVSLE